MVPPNGNSSARRGLTWAVAAAVGLAVWCVFHKATGGAMLQWDDDTNIQYNVHLRALSPENLRWMFTDSSYVRRYVPLGWLALAVDYRFFGPGPRSFHVLNLILHCADAGLVFFLALKLLRIVPETRPESRGWPAILAAAAGALLWAVHPLRVEAVARASGTYCQAAFFILLSILAYLESAGREPGTTARRLLLGGSVLAFAMSLTTYPLALGYTAVLVILDVLVLGRISRAAGGWLGPANRRVWIEKVPYAAVTVAVFAVTVAARYQARGTWEPPPTLAQFGLGSRILQAGYIWTYYLWKPFFPFNLSPVYTTLVWFVPSDPRFIASMAAVAAITALLFWRRRQWPGALALWLCHLVLLVPVLGLTEHPHYANDRYSYLVAIPVAAAFSVVLLRLGRSRPARTAALAAAFALVAVCARASSAQVGIWRDNETLFRTMLARLGSDPYRADILRRLGRYFRGEGRQAEAVAAFQEAVRAAPNWSIGHYELGSTLVGAGETDRGIAELQEALSITPGMLDARSALANALFTEGRLPEAMAAIEDVIRAQPSSGAYYDLSVVLGREGRLAEAMRACDEALSLDPANAQALSLRRALAASEAR
jgi:tetratricopeptide (TPR) repeat protein